MDFYQVLKTRRSIRKYKSTPVEPDKLDRILEAVRIAPSAANRQPWHFVVITDEAVRRSLVKAYSRDWFGAAPVVVCACAEPGEAWVRGDKKNYADVDVTIAFEHLVLAAAAEGLATCWIAAFDPAELRKILALPDGIEPLAITPVGYPDEKPRAFIRKALSEIVHRERW
jgi:nitroreductase